VAREPADLSARGHIPQPDGSVVRPGGQARPVRRKRHGIYITRVAREPADLSARGHIPQPDGVVLRPGGQARPVRRIRHGMYITRVALELADLNGRGPNRLASGRDCDHQRKEYHCHAEPAAMQCRTL